MAKAPEKDGFCTTHVLIIWTPMPQTRSAVTPQ
jgi:hypothetical protein